MQRNILLIGIVLVAMVLVLNTVFITRVQAAMQERQPAEFMPQGVPDVYGEELGVSYDAISPNDPRAADATINRLAQIDRQITLEGADKERYINVLYRMHGGMSCEYCCGARSVIFENGEMACGCAHSFAMRGVTKYLITQHGDEFNDEEILLEVAKWKALFFPTQFEQKAALLQSQGIEPTLINLASNEYRG